MDPSGRISVVMPASTEEVQKIVMLANQERFRWFPRRRTGFIGFNHSVKGRDPGGYETNEPDHRGKQEQPLRHCRGRMFATVFSSHI